MNTAPSPAVLAAAIIRPPLEVVNKPSLGGDILVRVHAAGAGRNALSPVDLIRASLAQLTEQKEEPHAQ
jgi:hypothetical protein